MVFRSVPMFGGIWSVRFRPAVGSPSGLFKPWGLAINEGQSLIYVRSKALPLES